MRAHEDCVALDADALREDVLVGNGEACTKCFPPIDLDLVAIPCLHICGAPVEGGLCTNRCAKDATVCSHEGHACDFHDVDMFSPGDPLCKFGSKPKKPRLGHPSPTLASEPQSGPRSTVGTLDAFEAPPSIGEVDSTIDTPALKEPGSKASVA